MGTTQYMSPEQARGQEIDTRSDIFSLGVVLYEMIVGRAPFEGPSASDVIAAILTKEPPPFLQSAPEALAELRRIIAKALRKEREERYQGIKDLLVDLKNLKQELQLEARAAQRESGDGKRNASGGERTVTAAQIGKMGVVSQTSSAEYLL